MASAKRDAGPGARRSRDEPLNQLLGKFIESIAALGRDRQH
jgi:hypothetical protein